MDLELGVALPPVAPEGVAALLRSHQGLPGHTYAHTRRLGARRTLRTQTPAPPPSSCGATQALAPGPTFSPLMKRSFSLRFT